MERGQFVIRDTYREMMFSEVGLEMICWFREIWHTNAQTKMIILFWLVWKDKVHIWQNLQRRGKIGPRVCTLCLKATEDTTHLFYTCPFAKDVHLSLSKFFHLEPPTYDYVEQCYKWWSQRGKHLRIIPIILHWCIWCSRNRWIFEDMPGTLDQVCTQAIYRWSAQKVK